MPTTKNTNRDYRSLRSCFYALAPACLLLSGCQQLGAFWAVIVKGGETLEAEYKLGQTPLAIVLDDPESLGVPADAMRAFQDSITQDFQEQKVNKQVVAFSELQKLR